MTGKMGKAARPPETAAPEIGDFRGRHLALAERRLSTEFGRANVTINEAESPLAWLARRRGRGGRALIEAHQLQAGERLRADFTLAGLMPRTTSNWTNPVACDSGSGTGGAAGATDAMVAARQRVHRALETTGPEFSGLLLDICCFPKGLEDVERERAWPPRTGKIVLQLALERLARHYGFAAQAHGRAKAPVRIWLAEDAGFGVESG
jgi:Domain of unknown function (DUF6456)